ncbi:MAG: polysaccharide export protein [Ottowia sp.]|nr:polysaccharide export protein [Ottowia sp.]
MKSKSASRITSPLIVFIVFSFIVLASGCSSYPNWIPSAGPSLAQVQQTQNNTGIQIVDVNDQIARILLANQKQSLFSEAFNRPSHSIDGIGPGDVLEVSVWEAPPAVLFGSTTDARAGAQTTRVTVFPEQMVNRAGIINIPFAGQISVTGLTPQHIETRIAEQLAGKAHQPQVLVRLMRNNTANVTVVGEVNASTRMPLTARGERLLDALAAAGGVRQPVNKTMLQLTRGDQVQALPLNTIIRDPKQNIVLHPGDVVTSLFQPLSFTVLGASGKNEEINFEAQGISLAQALARSGGLQDQRADARGIFIFRFESPHIAAQSGSTSSATPDGKVPVIYRIDLKDPTMFFVAQNFPVQDKDVLYIANAPAAELQKFLNMIMSVAYPVMTTINAVKQ